MDRLPGHDSFPPPEKHRQMGMAAEKHMMIRMTKNMGRLLRGSGINGFVKCTDRIKRPGMGETEIAGCEMQVQRMQKMPDLLPFRWVKLYGMPVFKQFFDLIIVVSLYRKDIVARDDVNDIFQIVMDFGIKNIAEMDDGIRTTVCQEFNAVRHRCDIAVRVSHHADFTLQGQRIFWRRRAGRAWVD